MDERKQEKDLISSEDVLAVVSGDQNALVEQLERAKEVAAEQLKLAHDTAQPEATKKRLEEELRKKEAQLAAEKKRVEEMMQQAQDNDKNKEVINSQVPKHTKNLHDELKKKKEEEKMKRQHELEQKQLAKSTAKKAKEEARKQKILARKQAKEQALLAKQKKKEEQAYAKEHILAQQQQLKHEQEMSNQQQNNNLAQQKAEEAKAYQNGQLLIQQQQQRYEEEMARRKAAQEEALARQKAIQEQAQLLAQQQQVKHEEEMARQRALQEQNLAQQKLEEQRLYAQKMQQNQQQNSSQPETLPSQNVQVAKPMSRDEKKEAKKRAKEERKANSNFKYYMTFIFFVGLILMVIFLPNISAFFSDILKGNQEQNTVITTGTLTCTRNTNDDKYDYYYQADFNFSDSKLNLLTFTTTIKGDRTLDAAELTEMKQSCELLASQVENMDGISIACDLREGVYKNEQILNYQKLDSSLVTTAYLEAGGTYPNYKYHQNINTIEKEMNAANYKCERHS